jgi:3-oxoacyl-[acyl-carrier protein] reductase
VISQKHCRFLRTMASLTDLSGRVALVTGASRGIGLAIADLLASQGASVVLSARSDVPKEAEGIAVHHGTRTWSMPADVRDAASVQALYRRVFAEAGRLDILVANAGVLEDALIGMISEEQLANSLATNVAGVLRHVQLAARLMRRNGAEGGSIISMSSIIGVQGNEGQMLYGATKAALLGMVRSASKELAPQGIRVNAIAPGFIDTDMTRALPDRARTRLLAGIRMKRAGTAEDVARVALFLASDLSRYVTGQVVGVDGGLVL